MTHLVQIVNQVNNAAIRRIKNARGDLVYIVPSYTLPDNCVMNGGLYPAEEIEAAYKSLEDTPAPAGHPYAADGSYISANSPEGILYFQCGIFNKNVAPVPDERDGYRVYVEKHIHIETAMQTERGRRIIDAIDNGQPIHTSTGVFVNRQEGEGVAANGKEYTWVASNMGFDHDAILLDEEGAATPEDGVGMMVNADLLKQVTRDGQTLSVNSAKPEVNQSFNDLRETLQSKIQKRFGGEDKHVWLADMGDDYAVFEDGETSYKVAYMRAEDNIMLDDTLQEVKKRTLWEDVASAVKSAITSPFFGGNKSTTNEGIDMFQKHIESVLKANSVDYSAMSDEQKIAKYDEIKANAANKTVTGEHSQPTAEQLVDMVNQAVEARLAANAKAEQEAQKAGLAEKLKANGVELEEADVKSMSVNALQTLVEKSQPSKPAFGLAGSSHITANSDTDYLSDTLAE
mgnify:CR=1 FL=1